MQSYQYIHLSSNGRLSLLNGALIHCMIYMHILKILCGWELALLKQLPVSF
jgi:hypothetical protein